MVSRKGNGIDNPAEVFYDVAGSLWEATPQQIASIIHFKGKMKDLEDTLEAIKPALRSKRLTKDSDLMAALATIAAETTIFQPIPEYGRGKGKKYGEIYYGRGYIQLTWDYNYKAYNDYLKSYLKSKFGDKADMLANPKLALDPGVAAQVLAHYFVNHTLKLRKRGENQKLYTISNQAIAQNFLNTRRLVNGWVDVPNGLRDFSVAADALIDESTLGLVRKGKYAEALQQQLVAINRLPNDQRNAERVLAVAKKRGRSDGIVEATDWLNSITGDNKKNIPSAQTNKINRWVAIRALQQTAGITPVAARQQAIDRYLHDKEAFTDIQRQFPREVFDEARLRAIKSDLDLLFKRHIDAPPDSVKGSARAAKAKAATNSKEQAHVSVPFETTLKPQPSQPSNIPSVSTKEAISMLSNQKPSLVPYMQSVPSQSSIPVPMTSNPVPTPGADIPSNTQALPIPTPNIPPIPSASLPLPIPDTLLSTKEQPESAPVTQSSPVEYKPPTAKADNLSRAAALSMMLKSIATLEGTQHGKGYHEALMEVQRLVELSPDDTLLPLLNAKDPEVTKVYQLLEQRVKQENEWLANEVRTTNAYLERQFKAAADTKDPVQARLLRNT